MSVSPAFTRNIDCGPVGCIAAFCYNDIQNLNQDMADELTRLNDGGDPITGMYDMGFCTGSTVSTEIVPIIPLLPDLLLRCDSCTMDGGVNLNIRDNGSTTFPLDEIMVDGITFQGFEQSILLEASAPTTLTIVNSEWSNFLDFTENIAEFVGPSPMTLSIMNSQVLNGNANALFVNTGGALMVDGLTVSGVSTPLDSTLNTIFQTTDNGVTLVENSMISSSTVASVGLTTAGQSTFSSVTVADMNQVFEVFSVRNAGSTMDLTDVTIRDNILATGPDNPDNPGTARGWDGILVGSGGRAVVNKLQFEGNTNFRYGAATVVLNDNMSQDPPTMFIADSNFVSNQGTPLVNPDLPRFVVGAVGNPPDPLDLESWNPLVGQASPNVDLLRTNIDQISSVSALVWAGYGGVLRYRQTCMTNSPNEGEMIFLAAFNGLGSRPQDVSLEPLAENNFQENLVPAGCNNAAVGFVFDETDVDGLPSCYVEGRDSFCMSECTFGVNQVPECLSDVILSEMPSFLPSESPTMSLFPTSAPTSMPVPTDNPTSAPTNPPTPLPRPPSAAPSPAGGSMTDAPTAMPQSSGIPSDTPSLVPSNPGDTASPTTMAPTNPGDTASPTLAPTNPGDTASPTTLAPTNPGDTVAPTMTPTNPGDTPSPTTMAPTLSPSGMGTATISPTGEIIFPTFAPTDLPTIFPTPGPTAAPTSAPTSSAQPTTSTAPTHAPTASARPTTSPAPSMSPTTPAPTEVPTSSPTLAPIMATDEPTTNPTIVIDFPTFVPTGTPVVTLAPTRGGGGKGSGSTKSTKSTKTSTKSTKTSTKSTKSGPSKGGGSGKGGKSKSSGKGSKSSGSGRGSKSGSSKSSKSSPSTGWRRKRQRI